MKMEHRSLTLCTHPYHKESELLHIIFFPVHAHHGGKHSSFVIYTRIKTGMIKSKK